MGYKFFNKEISGIFTIPSGIICTEISIIEKIAREIPEIGILTTKSISLKPKEGNKEPIIAKYAPFSFINAVGLTNPGAEEFTKKLSKAIIPKDKFLLISIFGDSVDEFKETAKRLYNYADGFELNVSCPHSKKYGQVIGQDNDLVGEIIKNVSSLGKPVFVKISPNLDVEKIAQCVEKNKASGITAINTKGPEPFFHDNFSVLSNKVGGVSGKAILDLGLEKIKKIRMVTDLPIIACGGILTAKDIKSYQLAGANFFGIGSALAGMSSEEIKKYFYQLFLDFKNNTNKARIFLKDDCNTKYQKYKIVENKKINEDLFVLKTDKKIKIEPGQFVFVWLPGKGEKPFSVLDDNPLTLLIKKRGCFTEELLKLKKREDLYIRGSYGNSLLLNGKVLLVGGGTGIAALYLFTKKHKRTIAVLGAKNKKHLPYIGKFKKACEEVFLVTENGKTKMKGLVTDNLEEILKKVQPDYCINCGPQSMIMKVIKQESKYINPENIYSSIDYMTKCGIGLCGSCATSKGNRNCVDGVFLKSNQI